MQFPIMFAKGNISQFVGVKEKKERGKVSLLAELSLSPIGLGVIYSTTQTYVD